MSSLIGDLLLRVGADLVSWNVLKSTFQQTQDSIQEFAENAEKAGLAFDVAFTLPFEQITEALVGFGEEFQAAEDHIIGATGAMGESLESLTGSFQTVFAGVPQSAAEVADAIGTLANRLDLAGPPLEAMAKQLLNLAFITGEQVNTLVEQSARLFQAWSLSTDEQADALDHLLQVSQASGTKIGALESALQQFGPVLREMGIGFNDAAAFVGNLDKAGLQVEPTLTSMTKALLVMSKNGLKDPLEGLQAIADGIRGAKTEGEAFQIGAAAFGKGAIAITESIRNGKLAFDDWNGSLKLNGQTVNDTAERMLDFGEKLEIVKNEIKVSLQPLGLELLDLFDSVLEHGRPLITWAEDCARAFTNLDGPTQAVVGGFVALTAAIGPLLSVAGLAAQGFKYVTEGLAGLSGMLETAGLSVSLSGIAYGFGLITANLALLHLDGVDADLIELYEAVSNGAAGLKELAKSVLDLVESLAKFLPSSNAFNDLALGAAKAFTGIQDVNTLLKLAEGAMLGFDKAVEQLTLKNLIDEAMPGLRILKLVLDDITAAVEFLSGNYASMSKSQADLVAKLDADLKASKQHAEDLDKVLTAAAAGGQKAVDAVKQYSAETVAAYQKIVDKTGEVSEAHKNSAAAIIEATAAATKEYESALAVYNQVVAAYDRGATTSGALARATETLDQAYAKINPKMQEHLSGVEAILAAQGKATVAYDEAVGTLAKIQEMYAAGTASVQELTRAQQAVESAFRAANPQITGQGAALQGHATASRGAAAAVSPLISVVGSLGAAVEASTVTLIRGHDAVQVAIRDFADQTSAAGAAGDAWLQCAEDTQTAAAAIAAGGYTVRTTIVPAAQDLKDTLDMVDTSAAEAAQSITVISGSAEQATGSLNGTAAAMNACSANSARMAAAIANSTQALGNMTTRAMDAMKAINDVADVMNQKISAGGDALAGMSASAQQLLGFYASMGASNYMMDKTAEALGLIKVGERSYQTLDAYNDTIAGSGKKASFNGSGQLVFTPTTQPAARSQSSGGGSDYSKSVDASTDATKQLQGYIDDLNAQLNAQGRTTQANTRAVSSLGTALNDASSDLSNAYSDASYALEDTVMHAGDELAAAVDRAGATFQPFGDAIAKATEVQAAAAAKLSTAINSIQKWGAGGSDPAANLNPSYTPAPINPPAQISTQRWGFDASTGQSAFLAPVAVSVTITGNNINSSDPATVDDLASLVMTNVVAKMRGVGGMKL